MAVSTWAPFPVVVVSHVIEYGAPVMAVPRLTPSNLNWTLATATLSVADAFTVTVLPETVIPVLGAVTVTLGGVVSEGLVEPDVPDDPEDPDDPPDPDEPVDPVVPVVPVEPLAPVVSGCGYV